MIGITEQGDAALDPSWMEKSKNMDGVILITKSPGAFINSEYETFINNNKSKFIIHCSITGFGKTFIEPNVSPYKISCMMFNELEKRGFNLVLRLDPIIPTYKGFAVVTSVITEIKRLRGNLNNLRIRWSLIDNYKHIKDRGINLPWSTFNSPEEGSETKGYVGANHVIAWLQDLEKEGAIIECCAENYSTIPNHWKIGCISEKDFKLFNLKIDKNILKSNQRKECLCLSNKTELLTNKKQCEHKCAYCYWK